MREIKFRAWDKDNKKWIERFYISGESGDVFDMVFGGWRHLRDDIELVEYTGLKDKNGEEIYEGDIVKSEFRPPNAPDVYAVEWVQRNAEFTIQPSDVCEKHIEIIGNIYENPELLEITTCDKCKEKFSFSKGVIVYEQRKPNLFCPVCMQKKIIKEF